jgi:hypothetical protein
MCSSRYSLRDEGAALAPHFLGVIGQVGPVGQLRLARYLGAIDDFFHLRHADLGVTVRRSRQICFHHFA